MKKSAPSTCSQESEGSALDLRKPDLFGQSLSVSKTPTPSASLKSTGPKSQSLKMSEPYQQIDLEELTSSVAGSPASRGPLPGSSEAQKMTVISGQKWLGLLKTYGLSGSLAKTCEALLTSPWASSAAFLTWKASGTKPSHLLFQLAPSTPRTDATECGLWRTPDAHCNRGANSEKRMKMKLENGMPISLNDQVAHPNLMWPTPRAQARTKCAKREDYHSNLEEAVGETQSGSLNPTWVEWLMGFPQEWTACDALETPSSQPLLSKSDGQSLKDGSNDLS